MTLSLSTRGWTPACVLLWMVLAAGAPCAVAQEDTDREPSSPAAGKPAAESKDESSDKDQPDAPASDAEAKKDGDKPDEPAAKSDGDQPPATPSPAEVKPAAVKPAVPDDTVRLFLMDGSVITGKLSVDEVLVETDFGALHVPVLRLRSFTPGMGSHPELGKQVRALIEDLGSSAFDEREAAQKAILKLGLPVRAELEKHQDDRDNERRNRLKAILAEFDSLEDELEEEPEGDAPLDRSVMIQRDTVETTEFTIVGRIVPKSFTVISPYGPLSVNLSDIRRGQRDAVEAETIRKSLSVEGAHIVQKGMKNSGLRVERGDKVSISATGTITMTPWGNQAVSTPEGAANYGWYVEGQIASGALVANIGDDGPVFKVGSKRNFTAERAGVLHFGVALQGDYANQIFPGQYELKIVVRRK